MNLAARFAEVRERIAQACRAVGRPAQDVALLAVSKTHPQAAVREALACGQLEFGENRVQELVEKAAGLSDTPARWHMIGSVQTNKVKDLLGVERLTLLHSLDREKLADALQSRLQQLGRREPLRCLIEINASGDAGKHGAAPNDAIALLQHVERACPALQVDGVMAMGPLDGDPRPAFALAARTRQELEQAAGRRLAVLSLGMSGDLAAAIAAGSTLVRIGTSLFGERD